MQTRNEANETHLLKRTKTKTRNSVIRDTVSSVLL